MAAALVKEEEWSNALPEFDSPPATVAISLDGTCTLMGEDGWREAMVGTPALDDSDCGGPDRVDRRPLQHDPLQSGSPVSTNAAQ